MIVAYARTNKQTTLQITTCYLLNNSDFVIIIRLTLQF